MCFKQTQVWRNSVTLFEYALSKNPEAAPYHTKLERLLATAYASENRFADALDRYDRILRRLPLDPMSHQNSAAILLGVGRWQEARAHYDVLLREYPRNAEYHDGLGIICAAAGNWGEAVDEFEAALRLNPELESGKRNLARALQNRR
jgi:tetratricopeptide (TPR) repeat protein